MDQERFFKLLERIANALERMAPSNSSAPNLVYDLSQYEHFDWEAIGATVAVVDEGGPALVTWGGNTFKRRSPNNKYGAAIFYSRCVGKENGENIYERLITFKEMSTSVEPLSRKAETALKLG